MRPALVLLHRWFGLGVAIFLFISGATGALISFDHELDAALNPDLFHAHSGETAQRQIPGNELARAIEAADPRLRIGYVMTGVEPGHTSMMSVEGKIDPATGKPYELGFNQIGVDPVTGKVQAKRQWGEISLSRENLLPFLYKLHYSMHIPEVKGIELGIWFMGIIAMVWVLDCVIALYLSFPTWRSWRKSFAFRWQAGGHKLNFDLHRSGGVWVWLLLLVLAITSVSMNLTDPVVRPLVSAVSTLSPDAFSSRTMNPPDKPIPALLSRNEVAALARVEGTKRGWTAPVGGVFYASAFGLYGVGFFEPGNDHGDVGLGNPWLYFDGKDGRLIADRVPGTGSAGDIFLQLQFPLHSGRIAGLTGRIILSFLGVMVAMLSVTGVIIWVRKRRARLVTRTVPAPALQPVRQGSATVLE
ncbi:PepSY-associated TM helix domain-containing protein [Massilia sp. DJPM01]|uniref:PepSY-associated TM helix domain-containing protein n=1 Tax=Massilia sp. DJPM01 TaxID=3024404 RepID=UPI00259FC298|nr:PepSY-associated TM helix domain-containing protein [Massilia sp. DJPM01]MDM5177527.1 PepSY-associated TM helix domain-containing protein [Massilia sp. DJPM01]